MEGSVKTKKKIISFTLLLVLVVVVGLAFLSVANNENANIKICNSCTTTVNKFQKRKVYLGGQPIGVQMTVGGVVVQSLLPVVTSSGVVTPLENCNVKKGDIITQINGVDVNNYVDVSKVIEQNGNIFVELKINRKGQTFVVSTKVVLDSITGKYKLGLSVVDSIDGIGTLTFVDTADMRFGALGHPINEMNKNCDIKVGGNICGANVFSVYKGSSNRAGELVGNLIASDVFGTIDKNETQGVFGNFVADTSKMDLIEVANKKQVKPGKAQIVTSAFNGKTTYYDIEIIKAIKQDKDKAKGLLYRVTDKRLIELSGGIVQGMSGSPIVQKGKLVGAVTHVFLSDSKKGYGTYIDWMIDK